MTANTDRELLELAAKAAGIALQWHRDIAFNVSDEANHVIWNPLARDGDALRLAVKLNLAFTCSNHETHVEGPRGADEYAWEPHGSDAYAATRRAIVRAAAAIGETL